MPAEIRRVAVDDRGMRADNPIPGCGMCDGRGWVFGAQIGRLPEQGTFPCPACRDHTTVSEVAGS